MPQYGKLKIDEFLYNDSGTDVTLGLSNIHVFNTGALKLNAGTTAQRPGSPAAGMLRYNSTLGQFEGYKTSWGEIGGGGAGATGGGNDKVFVENDQVITTSYRVGDRDAKNASSVGDLAINSGVTVTVPANARWVIL